MVALDEPILKGLDWCVRKWQDITGIPKWRITKLLWLSYIILCVPNLVLNPNGWILLKIATVIWAVWMAMIINRGRRDQEDQALADQRQAIVYNSARGGTGIAVRIFIILNAVFCIKFSTITGCALSSLSILAIYVSATHTFPMLGPTLLERLRNLIASPKPVEELG